MHALLREAAPVGAPPAAQVSYRLGDAVLDVDTAHAPLLEGLAAAYADCQVPAAAHDLCIRVRCRAGLLTHRSLLVLEVDAPGELPNLCEMAWRLTRHRVQFQNFCLRSHGQSGWRLLANRRDEAAPVLAGGAGRAVIDIRVAPPELVVDLVVAVLQLAQPGVTFVHAGGVSVDGRGTLLAGGSGKGKSTIAVGLASRGHGLLGDDTVGIRVRSREIVGFRRTLKLRRGPSVSAVAARLEETPHARGVDAAGVPCAWVTAGALFGGPPTLAAPLCAAIFLRDFSARVAIEPFVPTLAHFEHLRPLSMCLSALASWPPSPAQRLIRYARLVELLAQCRCYFLDPGAPDETVALIEETVRSHDPERP